MSLFRNLSIETPRLLLRTFRADDIDGFYEAARDPAIYPTLPEDHLYSRQEIADIVAFFIDSYERVRIGDVVKFPLAIIKRNDGRIIGNVGIGRYSGDSTVHEIFYFITSSHWNEGYASEAVAALLAYVHEHRIVDRLIGAVVPSNAASANILVKNGFIPCKPSYPDERDFYELSFVPP